MLRQGAVEGEVPYRKRNDVGEHDSTKSSHKCNNQRFGQKLDEDVEAASAQGFLDTNLAGALGDAHEHDVHETDATDSESERTNEREQHLQRHGDDPELRELFHQTEDLQRAIVVRTEIVFR